MKGLVVRSYLGSLDDRLRVTSELHQSINAKFNDAGISIAFPQRDVHLSTAAPLDVRVRPVRQDVANPSPETKNPTSGSQQA